LSKRINIENPNPAIHTSGDAGLSFELFVERGFEEFELAGIIRTLSLANDIHPKSPSFLVFPT
jgi:hypothetical protein